MLASRIEKDLAQPTRSARKMFPEKQAFARGVLLLYLPRNAGAHSQTGMEK
jgi:hypothetical protein